MERILRGVLQESMDRCNGRRDITEILLKTALNTIQSINQSIVVWERASSQAKVAITPWIHEVIATLACEDEERVTVWKLL